MYVIFLHAPITSCATRFGGYSERETPEPIPNSTVKPLRAHDTIA
jgi:hypothetical protein